MNDLISVCIPAYGKRFLAETLDSLLKQDYRPFEIVIGDDRPDAVDEALEKMELVGHDFYLFHDVETDKASVVYRRRGWSYGVLHLDLNGSAPSTNDTDMATTGQSERAAAS